MREAVLLEGPDGWTEFSPFVEYDDAEAAAWLRAAIDFGWQPTPPVLRTSIPVNATLPAVGAAEVRRRARPLPGLPHREGEGRRARPDARRRRRPGARGPRRISGPEGRIRVDANGGWNVDEAEHALHALAEFDLEYVEQPCADRRGTRRDPPTHRLHGHPDRRRRERAQGGRPARGRRGRRRRPARDQGAAARRHPRGARHRGARPGCRSSSRARSTPRSGISMGAPPRRRAARARLRLRARHRLAARRRCHAGPAAAERRRASRCAGCEPDAALLGQYTAAPARRDWWTRAWPARTRSSIASAPSSDAPARSRRRSGLRGRSFLGCASSQRAASWRRTCRGPGMSGPLHGLRAASERRPRGRSRRAGP